MYIKHKKSAISELIAQEFFISRECTVLKPINHFAEYDLVIDNNGSLYRVQIKSIYICKQKNKKKCKLIISHRKGNGNTEIKKYKANSFDILCCVDNESRDIYNIPSSLLINQQTKEFYTSITMSEYEQYKNNLKALKNEITRLLNHVFLNTIEKFEVSNYSETQKVLREAYENTVNELHR